jgi:hypothetical protein
LKRSGNTSVLQKVYRQKSETDYSGKIAHKMLRRILSVIKTKTPYKINHALQPDEKIVLPAEAEEIINGAEQAEEQSAA